MKNSVIQSAAIAATLLMSAPVFADDAAIAEATKFCTEWAVDDGFTGKDKADFISSCVAEETGQEVVNTNTEDGSYDPDSFGDSEIDAEMAE